MSNTGYEKNIELEGVLVAWYVLYGIIPFRFRGEGGDICCVMAKVVWW